MKHNYIEQAEAALLHTYNRYQIVLEKGTDTTAFETETAQETAMLPEVTEEVQPTEEVNEVLYVHVCGAVEAEGVYSLPAGSRVLDGIAAAGGFCETADTAYHNLASRLSDGQKVYVPTKQETSMLSVTERVAGTEGTPGSEKQSDSGKAAAGEPVNLNTAGLEELMTLSGIGEAKAESILQYREKVGPFQSIEELKNVSGIGDAMFERVKAYIVVE